MIDTEMKILAGIFLLICFFNIKYAIYFSIFITLVYLFGFFFTSIGLDIDVHKLEKSTLYYQEYTGDYEKLFPRLTEFNKIKNKFKLPTKIYNPFGIFYDDPSEVKEKSKCRAIVGIIKENCSDEENTELVNYLKNNNFKTETISDTQCIIGTYPSIFSIQNSFIFIAKLIIEMTNMKFFRRLFIPKWKENKIKLARNNYKKHFGVLEIFREGKIDLLIPYEKERQFFLHSEGVAPTKLKK